MPDRVLFLGESELSGPACYLAAILTWAKLGFDHRPDQSKIPKAWRRPGRYRTIILSDYRYESFTPCAKEWLLREVREQGTGLLMIGGWASFTGRVGGYAGTDLETLLPVHCIPGDDRVNRPSGAVLLKREKREERRETKPVTLPLSPHSSPVICGYNRAVPKPGTTTEWELADLSFHGQRVSFGMPQPLLVRGRAGQGKTAALLTDCAPHWAGGLVDWGARRKTVYVTKTLHVEVGDRYLQEMSLLIRSLFPTG